MKILIIEDEYSIADAMREGFKKEGFSSAIVTNGQDGEDEALTGIYDLVILDVMLPGKNGFEILHSIKNNTETPVIMVTAKSEITDKLNGLENGADDYITKPFHIKEIIARINLVLKRYNKPAGKQHPEFGDIMLDVKNSEMVSGGTRLRVTGKEFQLIEVLVMNKGNVVSREMLASKIWGYSSDAEYNNVEVYVSFLRKKLKLLRSTVKIVSVRGVGYRLEESNA